MRQTETQLTCRVKPDCGGEVTVVVDRTDDGDGVWSQSGITAWVPARHENGPVTCSEGCVHTTKQVEALEDAACRLYCDYA